MHEIPDGTRRLIGSSRAIRELRARIRRLGPFDEPVLVLGETGTGKELVARALHVASPRRASELQVIQCAGVGPDVLAAELFGHAAGAFTGATHDRQGRIRAAEGSTLVLDEVTETPDAFQAALLRAIEYGEVQPVGRDRTQTADVRYVATSNRPLAELSSGDGLRSDLFHRLAAFVLLVPPLRERPEDVPELAEHFLDEMVERYGEERRLTPAALDLLAAQPFPGNVRELRQVVVRSYVESSTEWIDVEDAATALAATSGEPDEESVAPVSLESVVRRHIQRTLRLSDGNLSQAARLLDVPRSTLQHYLVKYRVETPAAGRRRKTAT